MAKALTLEAAIARFEEARDELDASVRAAHTATKEAREAEKAASKARAALEAAAKLDVEHQLDAAVSVALTEFGKQVSKAMADTVEKIDAEFDRYKNVCMFGNEQGHGQNIFDAMREAMVEYHDDIRTALQILDNPAILNLEGRQLMAAAPGAANPLLDLIETAADRAPTASRAERRASNRKKTRR